MKTACLSLIVVSLLLFGCASSHAWSEKDMNELGAALTKLSSSVESTVYYKKQGLDLPDEKLLLMATQHDPGLLDRFQEYKLRVLQQNSHSAVLVCTPDGRAALLEDAGCTARMDRYHWKAQPLLPCEFTLDLVDICTGPK